MPKNNAKKGGSRSRRKLQTCFERFKALPQNERAEIRLLLETPSRTDLNFRIGKDGLVRKCRRGAPMIGKASLVQEVIRAMRPADTKAEGEFASSNGAAPVCVERVLAEAEEAASAALAGLGAPNGLPAPSWGGSGSGRLPEAQPQPESETLPQCRLCAGLADEDACGDVVPLVEDWPGAAPVSDLTIWGEHGAAPEDKELGSPDWPHFAHQCGSGSQCLPEPLPSLEIRTCGMTFWRGWVRERHVMGVLCILMSFYLPIVLVWVLPSFPNVILGIGKAQESTVEPEVWFAHFEASGGDKNVFREHP